MSRRIKGRIFVKKGTKTWSVKVWRPITGAKQMYGCATKLVHYDFLSAMRHANKLRAIEPNGHFNVYPCRFCEGIHVGHCKQSVELTEDFEEWRIDDATRFNLG